MKIDREKLYPWLAILRARYMGSGRAMALEKHFGSISKALHASPTDIAQALLSSDNQYITRHAKEVGESIKEAANGKFDKDIDKELKWAEKDGVSILIYSDPDFPFMLHHIPAPPSLLYVKGTLQQEDLLAFGIVGSRGASDSGKRQAGKIANELAEAGLTIVSGLAYGVDANAHYGALKCKSGRTFAVLGNGLSMVYPKEHKNLADQIVNRGALITELFHDVSPQGKNFPPRNRIISGLSLGVLIVEASEKSGSLITADYALNQGKEVFAMPGAVEPGTSPGTNKLIQDSAAKLVMNASEILSELQDKITYYRNELEGKIPRVDIPPPPVSIKSDSAKKEVKQKEPDSPKPQPNVKLTDDEAFLCGHLSTNAKHIDELCREVGWTISKVSSVLGLLEFKDVIVREGGMKFRLND